jgi:hypothetical protein
MNDANNLLLKSAMSYGLALGIYWIAKYFFFITSISYPSLNLIYWLLTIAVPVVAWILTKRYRDNELSGEISFFHAWRFGTMLYFFAAVIIALVHFVFYQYIAPHDFLSKAYTQVIDVLNQSAVDTTILESFKNVKVPSPIHMAIQGIFNNVFYGILLSIPVAALVRTKTTASESKPSEEESK